MYDGWLQAVESGQMAGVCMLDMSAAFDVVDHDLLNRKLSLYGFDENSLEWVSSYLSGRSQCVMIEGCLSKLLPVNVGVPQGSILGPLFYTLFTNELPEVIHDSNQDEDEAEPVFPAYHMAEDKNGSIVCYADDTTFTCTEANPVTLSNMLTAKYKVISQFMANNRLKLNDDKTHLLVITTGQARGRADNQVQIVTPTETIRPTKHEKLLGCWINDDLKWTEHIRDNQENLITALNTRLGALKKIQKLLSFKTRKMIAEGIFNSKLSC